MPSVIDLPPEALATLEAGLPAVAEAVGTEADAEPAQIVAALEAFVASQEQIPDEAVMALGSLLGAQYVRAFDWRWVALDYGEQGQAYAVLSPDGGVGNQAMNWVYSVVHGTTERNFLVNFAAVAAGELPEPDGEGPVMFA